MKRYSLFAVLGIAGAVAATLLRTGGALPSGDVPAIQALESRAPFLIGAAMAQTHALLVDRHKAAGLTCASCHGKAAFTEPVEAATCMRCHGSYAQLADRTPWEPNPHRSHMGELACSVCHNVHKPSVSFCDQCHSFGMDVP